MDIDKNDQVKTIVSNLLSIHPKEFEKKIDNSNSENNPFFSGYYPSQGVKVTHFNFYKQNYLYAEQGRKLLEEKIKNKLDSLPGKFDKNKDVDKLNSSQVINQLQIVRKELEEKEKFFFELKNKLKLLTEKIIDLRKRRLFEGETLSEKLSRFFYNVANLDDRIFIIKADMQLDDTPYKDYDNYQKIIINVNEVIVDCLRFIPDYIFHKKINDYYNFFEEIDHQVDSYLVRRISKHYRDFLFQEKQKIYTKRKISSDTYQKIVEQVKTLVFSRVSENPSFLKLIHSIDEMNEGSINLFKQKKQFVLLKKQQMRLRYEIEKLRRQYWVLYGQHLKLNGIDEKKEFSMDGQKYSIFSSTQLDYNEAIESVEEHIKNFLTIKKKLLGYETVFISYSDKEYVIPYVYYATLCLNKFKKNPNSFLHYNKLGKFFGDSSGLVVVSACLEELDGFSCFESLYKLREQFENEIEFTFIYDRQNEMDLERVKKLIVLQEEVEKGIFEIKCFAYEILDDMHYVVDAENVSGTLRQLQTHVSHYNEKYTGLVEDIWDYLDDTLTEDVDKKKINDAFAFALENLRNFLEWFDSFSDIPPFSLECNKFNINQCKKSVFKMLKELELDYEKIKKRPLF